MANFQQSGRHQHKQYDNDGGDDSDSSSGTQSQHTQNGGHSARQPPKKRNRAALSCTLCRERKVKCDRVIPCQQCIKRGDAEYCHLDPNKRGPQSTAKASQAKKQQQQQQPQQSQHHSHGHTNGEASLDSLNSISSTSSAAEVDAIKARLAQLEHALAQKHSGSETSPGFSSHSSSGFSPLGGGNGGQSGTSTSMSWSGSNFNNNTGNTGSLPAFTTSPANQHSEQYPSPHFMSSQRSSSASNSYPTPPKMPSFFSQTGLGDGVVGRLPPIGNAPSPNGGMGIGPFGFNSFDRNRNRAGSTEVSNLGSSFAMPSMQQTLQKEDASELISTPGNSTHRGDVDSDTEDAALVLEGLAMGAGRGGCDGKKQKRANVVQDIIEKAPLKSIQGYVEQDKTKDIMSESHASEVSASDAKVHKELTQTFKRGALPLMGPTDHAGAETCPGESDCDALAELLKQDPDAEFGPDGKRIPPAKRVCILLSRHEDSLFNLVYGPETYLGWGMGWAFPAAEAAGDMMKVSEVVGCKGALQREAVLRAMIRSLPDRASAEHLINVFESRVKFLSGNCIHIPTFKKEMAAFYDLGSVEKRARVINFVDPGWLSLFFMILVLSLHFHPCERPESVMHFFDGRTLHLWRSAAHTSLVLARYHTSTSMAVLQTIILINLHSMGTGKENFGLMHVAITNAIEMGLHKLGSKDKQPKAGENSGISIRREIAKRIWHHFVFTDWCSAGMHGGIYRIHPSQFNTPLPGNYNDSDLCIYPLPAPRPTSEHTEMSFILSQLQVAIVNRENVDMQNAKEKDSSNGRLTCSDTAYLDGRYRGLLEQAPSFYRIGSDEGENENTEVERWLFQQSVFHKLLRLHRPQLSSKTSARTSCVLLARSILDMQRRIRSRCSVVDRLFLNLGQSFSAAIVLCLDLLQTPPTATMRSIVRDEVSEALKALRHVGASHHATENNIRVIEALLEEEEVRWKQVAEKTDGIKRKRDGNPGQQRKKNLLNLAMRVAKAANGQEPFKPTGVSGEETTDPENSDVTMMDGSQQAMLNPSTTTFPSKDEQSRQLLEQLMMGRPNYDEPSSFSAAPFQTNNFNQPSAHFAPNGLDLSQSFSAFSESNEQPFDLSKFLAECDSNSSPGSVGSGTGNYDPLVSSGASDSGHSSLHGGRENSITSGGRLSHSSSMSQLAGGSPNTNSSGIKKENGTVIGLPASVASQGQSPNAVEQPTGLDGFWNWILNQGSLNSNSETTEEFRPPLGTTPISSTQMQSQAQAFRSSYSQNVASQFQDLFSRSLTGDKKSQLDESATSQQGGAAAGSQSFASPARRSQTPQIFSSSFSTSTNNTANTSNNNNDEGAISLGTPSAGMGHSWMSTPGLFEFAYEFSNDSSNNPPTSQPSSQQQPTTAALSWS